MTNVVCIIQARMGSTRLPGKVMKKIKGKSVLFYVVERVKKSRLIDQIVIATTTNKQDEVIVEEAERLNVKCFRGSEQDVLSRYYYAAKKFDADVIVRITSDCPLIDSQVSDIIINYYLDHKNEYDYVGNAGPNRENRTYPRGLDTEVFSFDVLKEAFDKAKKNYQREHVTPFIYENSERFNIYYLKAEGKLKKPGIRITLDTEQDFELIYKVINHFENIDFNTEDVINFLENHAELLKINRDVKQKSLNE
jgi:spore coat polysaccharide biosynthesis protein SpsF